MAKKTNKLLFQLGRYIVIGEKKLNRFETGPVANFSCAWWIKWKWNILNVCLIHHGFLCHRDDGAWGQCQTCDIAARKILTFWWEEKFIMKCEVNQSFTNSFSVIVFQYYLVGFTDMVQYTSPHTFLMQKSKPSNCIVFTLKMIYWNQWRWRVIDPVCTMPYIMSCCLNDVWTGRFPPGKKLGIKQATYKVVNDLKWFIS